MIEQGRSQKGDRDLEADVAVVGSGAAGAMAAAELARRGARVVVLEEGPWLPAPRSHTQREDEMMPLLYQEAGGRSTADLAIRVLGGRCIGGSTVHNTNLCKRTPPEILARWEREHAVSGCSARELGPVFESVERDLSILAIPPDDRNPNNRILERGARALHWRAGGLHHNRKGCQRSGFCELGCPFDGKQNASKVLIPLAEKHGALIVSDARVEAVVHQRGRVRGVDAVALDVHGQSRGAIRVRAGAVVLAGSAIGSAVVAGRSGLPDPHRRLGRGLRLHPGIAVAGVFPEKVEGWRGIPQSYECTEWLDFGGAHDARPGDEAPAQERRVWITTVFAHPIGSAVMLPGFGPRHREFMLRYPHLGVLTAMVHDVSEGHVGVRPDGRARISYELVPADLRQLALGARACARLLFAAGASEVLIPSTPPLVLARPDAVDSLPESVVAPHSMAITSVHPLGTLPLGEDPRRSVVKSTGEHHQVEGLFVLDGSLFPTSIGVPPQVSIYTFARHLSRFVAERCGR